MKTKNWKTPPTQPPPCIKGDPLLSSYTLSLCAILLGFLATFLLAALAVKGVHVEKNGSISMRWSKPPPADPIEREKWGRPRYWAYRLGMPIGMFLFLVSCVLQIVALTASSCTP